LIHGIKVFLSTDYTDYTDWTKQKKKIKLKKLKPQDFTDFHEIVLFDSFFDYFSCVNLV